MVSFPPQDAKSFIDVFPQSSGMNLNPQQDGLTIFVPIPKVRLFLFADFSFGSIWDELTTEDIFLINLNNAVCVKRFNFLKPLQKDFLVFFYSYFK